LSSLSFEQATLCSKTQALSFGGRRRAPPECGHFVGASNRKKKAFSPNYVPPVDFTAEELEAIAAED